MSLSIDSTSELSSNFDTAIKKLQHESGKVCTPQSTAAILFNVLGVFLKKDKMMLSL